METPEFYQGAAAGFHYSSQFTPEKTKNGGGGGGDSFIVDELLADFPSDDGMVVADGDGGESFEFETSGIITGGGTSTTEDSVGVVQNSCNSSFSGSTEPSSSHFPGGGDIGCGGNNFTDGQFSSELCVPYDDLAELEWLSNFVEESFSSDDLQKLQLISGMKAQTTDNSISQTYQFQPEPNRATSTITATATATTMFRPEMSVPAKARSKRSRAPPCNWTSRLLAVSPSLPPPPLPTTVTTTTSVTPTPTMSSSSESDIVGKKKVTLKKKETYDNGMMPNTEGRRCLHCATDKTPQWRTGPMGPKTLCNACGVRYKSGRLVPEYRPAASPTFVLTKHSNSHRKVLELRRQKEFQRVQPHQPHHQQQFIHPNMMFDVPPGDDFLIHQHLGTDFRQLI